MTPCSPYEALTRRLRRLDPAVPTFTYTFGELHAELGQRLPMGAEIASAWEGPHCALAKAVAAANFRAALSSTERGWTVTFTRVPATPRAEELAGSS